MTPERWEQVVALFHEAREYTAETRQRFLDGAVADSEVRRGVEGLLRADATEFSLLDASPGALAEAAGADERVPRLEGQRLGPYTLLREIGRGGMAVVYLAEHEDLAKRVALKLVVGGRTSPDRIARFIFERRVLAQLDHPHVARALDAGVTDDGTPWFAMEYVEGEPLDVYCDVRRLGVDERLALFEQVCEAVSYAHQSLVVHRDLKPRNILVTATGEVKLLDFGIAKLLESQPGATRALTGAWDHPMTPAYAAPEQIRGTLITTATDVYGLGVLLHELLTGRRPHAPGASRALEEERAVAGREPERPSAVVARATESPGPDGSTTPVEPKLVAAARGTTVGRLRRRLRGDLDAITLKALAQDPTRRYESAERLLEDLRRRRRGFPVAARPDTVAYRAARFGRRHRAGVAAASLTALSLVGGLAGALWQADRAAHERDVAMRERDRATQVVEFITGVLSAADPSEARGDTLTVYDLLARSERRIDSALAGQPEVRAELSQVMGRVYGSLGEYSRARPLLESALATRRGTLGDDPERVAETANELAAVLQAQGEYDAAERLRGEALSIQRARPGEDDAAVAATLGGLASIMYAKGAYADGADLLKRALAINRRVGADPVVIAGNLDDLATTLRPLGKLDEAEALFREALAIRRRALGDDHPSVPSTLTNLAALLRDFDDYAAAEPLFREALATRQRILGNDHPDVALTLIGLAYTLHWKGDYAGAESLYRRALAIDRKQRGPVNLEVGMDLFALATMLQDRGGSDAEAERLYRTSLSVLRSALPPTHARISMPLTGLGSLLLARGRAGEAEPMLRESVKLRVATLGEAHRVTAQAQSALGACLTQLGRYAEAEPLLLRSERTLVESARPGRSEPRRLTELRRARERLLALYTARNDRTRVAEYDLLLASGAPNER